ncbi:MAG: 16S rRNA (guanine(966)-N(2))-methyltransferase RsmD [Candidatus Omnitrophota bacterium]
MRITSGKYRSRIVQMPKGIRPTQDKVRKAIFDILGDIEGVSFLELFAGSGAVGFEAASRGVAELTLVEYNRDCLLTINKNIESLKLKACNLYQKQADAAIEIFYKDQRKFDIIFLDPPYYEGLSKKTLQTLSLYDILTPTGLIVAQHFKKDILPESLGELTLFKHKSYGDTVLSFYRKGES